MIERCFNIPFIASLALREKQIQQNYRPIIAVHKWFARRPGTLFRGLLLAEFAQPPLDEAFYQSHDLAGKRVADPFMGGGTPLLEANRAGCDVVGYDINPMAYWIVRQEIEHLDLEEYRQAAERLRSSLKKKIGHLYRTTCLECGSPEASVKYFLWVKIHACRACRACGEEVDLFPGHLVAKNARHPRHVLVCPGCGALNEADDPADPGNCASCSATLNIQGPARRNRCVCPHCDVVNLYPDPDAGPPRHRLFAIEYHCHDCRPHHKGRFFKQPDEDDLARVAESEAAFSKMRTRFVPDDEILAGDESDRLHRWGYRHYRELFNSRQLLGLETSARLIAKQASTRVRNALATNLSDLLRYQNMLCRYDTMALKSLDIFSVHGFPVGLIECESNLLGIVDQRRGIPVGSGGWTNIMEKYAKAKAYCDKPFEVRLNGKRKVQVAMDREWIGDNRHGPGRGRSRKVKLHGKDATSARLAPASLDAVFTDPPYFGNVQYAELMDFCYVWLRRLVGKEEPVFQYQSTRNTGELTVNESMARGLEHFTAGLSRTFQRMARALKPGAPLAFTYHHNKLDAYYPIAVAILDAGLTCSASLPCPAEMGASIHINGTGSSIIDTIFVCRSTGSVPRQWFAEDAEQAASLVKTDLDLLRQGGVEPTPGDTRCIIYGHLIRLAIWHLRRDWDKELPIGDRLARLRQQLVVFGTPDDVVNCLDGSTMGYQYSLPIEEEDAGYKVREEAVAF